MRELKGADVFPFMRVIKTSNAHKEMADLAIIMRDNKEISQTALGMQFILGLINNCASREAEEAIWTFLSGPMEKTEDELKDMDLDKLLEELEKLVDQNIQSGNLVRFFGLVRKLMGQNYST